MRLGIVGAESTHVDQVLRLARAGALGPGVDVAVVAVPDAEPAGDDRLATLRRAGAAATRSGTPERTAALLARSGVQAVLLATRDARGHRALAEPLLRAGLPLLVDKPFTADPEDAARLVELAAAHGLPLSSASALRLHPDVRALAARWRPSPSGLTVTASGPADPASPHGGLAFTAVHVVEAALGVLRDPVSGPVAVVAGAGTRTALVPAGRDVGVVTVATPGRGADSAGTPYQVAVTGADGREDVRVELGADYLRPVLSRFLAGVRSGTVAPSGAALVDAVRVLAALCA
ncbi:Gfo/Idh/MocA family oxidoreductase [Cellulomonas sp. C5510]|uniref:Gfo/Idh/MocA family oxidoreductase n=1 Tax=Cellulomonas sp. C5510 TaxID=2871170 RepID=UPI001C98CC69|nr:Gfo/Idh/MocA family oxidoreductase [Cellulomonas sp. C5510]QZN85737.1 Gfo/Idh/MocA family oxidoreductase [Cellulomonas sp. C5510]